MVLRQYFGNMVMGLVHSLYPHVIVSVGRFRDDDEPTSSIQATTDHAFWLW
jgi:hypothetical protein